MSFNKRLIYGSEHNLLRDEISRFLESEVVPQLERWEEQGHADRDTWNKLGDLGAMCPMIPESYGGPGSDMRACAVIYEEMGRCGVAGVGGVGVHDIVAYYLLNNGSEELKQQWLPKAVSGEALFAVAMTEPAAGSDLRGIRLSLIHI